jgi:16S rRNA (adenine1518-N6/adenine1519-N6)-dimethyltransferase
VVPRWLCDAAEIKPGETVVEIGAGTGALTRALLARGARVLALETDERAIAVLEKECAAAIAAAQLSIHNVDVRRFAFSDLDLSDRSFKIVANIPYYLSGFLFRTCLSGEVQPSDLVFLVQKEVAKRASASLERGEKESLLSLSLKVFGEVQYVREVSRGHFTPPPQVDSGLIKVSNISRNNFKDLDQAAFFELLHLGFGQKRKQLLGNLAKKYDREVVSEAFSTVGIKSDVRAEDLPLKIWLKLARILIK